MRTHPAFSSAPDLAQFAKARDWANAWKINPAELPDAQSLRAYLAGRDEIAFEALFGDAFWGVRFSGSPQEVEVFSCACVSALAATRGGQGLLPALEAALGQEGWGKEMKEAEIGLVNHWHRHGPLVLAPPVDVEAELAKIWETLYQSPLGQDTSKRKAIEFAYPEPYFHWFALPVSHCENGQHRLDRSLLEAAWRFAGRQASIPAP